MRIRGIRHVTVAVRDLDRARQTFEALFGASAGDASAESIPAFGVRAQNVAVGEDTLQLAEPLGGDHPVMRFLERRGEGFYVLGLEVEDLDAAIEELTARGIRVSAPVESRPGERSAFLAMSATHGLSLQLVEVAAAQPPDEQVGTEQLATSADAEQSEPEAKLLDLTPEEWSDVD
jgi:methylmalonyl-CoA epimerase